MAHRISAAVFSFIIVATGILMVVPPEVLACVPASGSRVVIGQDQTITYTRGSNWDCTGSGPKTSTATYRTESQCYYAGSRQYGDPRENTPAAAPKWNGSVLAASRAAPGDRRISSWISAWENRINAKYTNGGYGANANMLSLFMRDKRADLLATAMQIHSDNPSVPSSWRLRFQAPSVRDDLIEQPGSRIGNYYSPGSLNTYFGSTGVYGGNVSSIGLRGDQHAINAWAWGFGTRELPNAPNAGTVSAMMMVDTYRAIGAYAGISADVMMSSSNTRSMNALLWPSEFARRGTGQYNDPRVTAARYSYWNWWNPDFPVKVFIKHPTNGSYYQTSKAAFEANWTAGYYPAGTKYNVMVFFPNSRAKYTQQQVIEGFKHIVRSQVNVGWNDPPVASGGNTQPGSYWVPTFQSGTGCQIDSFNVLGLNFGRTGTGCNAASLTADRQLSNFDGSCNLIWKYLREEPPAIPPRDFTEIMNQMGQTYSAITFRPDTAAAVVGEPITFRAQNVRERGLNFTNRLGSTDVEIAVNITQVGVFVSLGSSSTPLLVIPRSTRAGSEYNFTYTFQQTPASRLQDPACAGTRNAADLLRICGIRFNAEGEPEFVLTFRTWFTGEYQYRGPGFTSTYRGLFSSQHAEMSADVRSRIVNWRNSWTQSFDGTRKAFDRQARSNTSVDISPPWPLFGSTSPDAYGTPMYHTRDTTLTMPVIQVQPAQNE